MAEERQQNDENLLHLSAFLSFKAEVMSDWDAWLNAGGENQVEIMTALDRVPNEMGLMRKELGEEVTQREHSKHPLVEEARAEMCALIARLSEIHFSVTYSIDYTAIPTGGVTPHQLLRLKCARLLVSYLRPLEVLAAKLHLESGLSVESSHLKPLSDQERAVDEVILEANEGGRAITGPAILKRLDEKSEKDINLIDGDSLKRVLRKLRLLRGLENRRNVGYFYPRHLKEP